MVAPDELTPVAVTRNVDVPDGAFVLPLPPPELVVAVVAPVQPAVVNRPTVTKATIRVDHRLRRRGKPSNSTPASVTPVPPNNHGLGAGGSAILAD